MAFRFHRCLVASAAGLLSFALFLVTSIKIMDLGGQNLDRKQQLLAAISFVAWNAFCFLSLLHTESFSFAPLRSRSLVLALSARKTFRQKWKFSKRKSGSESNFSPFHRKMCATRERERNTLLITITNNTIKKILNKNTFIQKHINAPVSI